MSETVDQQDSQVPLDQINQNNDQSGQEKELPLTQQIFKYVWENEANFDNFNGLKSLISDLVKQHLATLSETYFIVWLWSQDSISNDHRDAIYEALQQNFGDDGVARKSVLLVLKSPGGSIEPAYKISKICNQLSKSGFEVVIPREAKSAATLISLGATKIHMGYLSELGPIDPQIGGFPALGLQDSLKYIAELVKAVPESSELFSSYLGRTLPIRVFGWANRVTESAEQYGQKLLTMNQKITRIDPAAIPLKVKKLVHEYKDHGFVIDCEEAKSLLSNEMVEFNSTSFRTIDKLYKDLNLVNLILGMKWEHRLQIVGSANVDAISFFSLK